MEWKVVLVNEAANLHSPLAARQSAGRKLGKTLRHHAEATNVKLMQMLTVKAWARVWFNIKQAFLIYLLQLPIETTNSRTKRTTFSLAQLPTNCANFNSVSSKARKLIHFGKVAARRFRQSATGVSGLFALCIVSPQRSQLLLRKFLQLLKVRLAKVAGARRVESSRVWNTNKFQKKTQIEASRVESRSSG